MSLASQSLNITLLKPKNVLKFGVAPILVKEFNSKALAGFKTTTTTWPISRPIPWGPGDYSNGLDEKIEPLFLMKALTLVECNFEDCAQEHALNEAEGDFNEWSDGHFAYYNRSGETDEDGKGFGDGAARKFLREKFEIVWVRDGVEWFRKK